MTRQQIINLIKQYIYTNGNQKVTAAQLREILLEIANAFAMETGTASGIGAVLDAGNQVTDGQKIVNAKGGTVLLSENFTIDAGDINVLGFEYSVPQYQSASYLAPSLYYTGALKRSRPELTFFTQGDRLEEGEFVATTGYFTEPMSEDAHPGVVHMAADHKYFTTSQIWQNAMHTNIRSISDTTNRSAVQQETNKFNSYVYEGPQSSEHEQWPHYMRTKVQSGKEEYWTNQDVYSFTWGMNGGEIANIKQGGLTLYNFPGSGSSFSMYSSDQFPGNAVPHFRTGNGSTVMLYRENRGVSEAIRSSGAGVSLTDKDTFDGYTLAQIVKALRNFGLLD